MSSRRRSRSTLHRLDLFNLSFFFFSLYFFLAAVDAAVAVVQGARARLRVRVHGDAGEVVPDDLVDCGEAEERKRTLQIIVRRCDESD